jgi:hypothetical protein
MTRIKKNPAPAGIVRSHIFVVQHNFTAAAQKSRRAFPFYNTPLDCIAQMQLKIALKTKERSFRLQER